MPGGASNTRMELRNSSGDIIPLYNSNILEEQLRAIGKSVGSFSGKVNSLRYSCRGRTSISGWFLTDCKSINDLLPQIYSGTGFEEVSLTLVDRPEALEAGHDPAVGGGGGGGSSVSHKIDKLYVTHAHAATGVIRADINKPNDVGSRTSELQRGHDPAVGDTRIDNHDNQMYVLYVVDYRYYSNVLGGVASNHNVRQRLWDEDSTTTVYDISDGFTWQSMITQLWGGGGVSLGHGKANYPSSGPFNYQFWGVTAYDALHKVLDDIDHTLIRNLDGTVDVADMATYDSTSSSERGQHKGNLIEVSNDLSEPVLPSTIFVVFPKWDYQFQTGKIDELTPQDYWHNRPIWYEEKDTNALIYSSAKLANWKATHGSSVVFQPGGFKILHDGLIAQFDPRLQAAGDSGITDGGATPANNTEIEATATARATAYIEARINGDNAIFREVYMGYIPFTPTRNISCITWMNSGSGAKTVIESVGRSLDSRFIATSKDSSRGSGGGETSSGYDLQSTSSRRVSQEFPGSPDHARLSEPVLRWAIVETPAKEEEEDATCYPSCSESEIEALEAGGIPPEERKPCILLYGLEAEGSITFHKVEDGDEGEEEDRTIDVTNISKTETIPPETRVFAYWNEQIREWVTSPGGSGKLTGGEKCVITEGRGEVEAPYVIATCIEDVKLLRVNKDSLLRSFERTTPAEDEDDDCADAHPEVKEMLISIDPAPLGTDFGGGYVMASGLSISGQQGNGLGKVRWTEGPHIGKHLIIGSTQSSIVTTPAYIDFLGNSRTLEEAEASAAGQGGNFTLMAQVVPGNTATNYIGNGSYTTTGTKGAEAVGAETSIEEQLFPDATMIFPNNDTLFRPGMHMSIKETGSDDPLVGDNNCFRMRWTSPGVWGSIDVPGLDYNTDGSSAFEYGAGTYYTLWFDDGVVCKVERHSSRGGISDDNYLGIRTPAVWDDADCTTTPYTPPDPCDADPE